MATSNTTIVSQASYQHHEDSSCIMPTPPLSSTPPTLLLSLRVTPHRHQSWWECVSILVAPLALSFIINASSILEPSSPSAPPCNQSPLPPPLPLPSPPLSLVPSQIKPTQLLFFFFCRQQPNATIQAHLCLHTAPCSCPCLLHPPPCDARRCCIIYGTARCHGCVALAHMLNS